jgi:hypothetical protein
MADLDITIKRKNGAGYDVLHPTTIIGQVTGLQTALDAKINTSARGAANGVASLDGNSKIPVAQLPNEVFDSLYYFDVIDTNLNLATIGQQAISNATFRKAEGYYWVATANTTVSFSSTPTLIGGKYYGATLRPSEEGVALAGSGSEVLEKGDWIILTTVGSQDGATGPTAIQLSFAIVNNTYELATSALDGIVRLSSSTLTSTTGNNVITDGILNGLVTTTVGTANKIAASAHNHDSAYLGISSNAVSASRWANARTITLGGDLTGSVSIDGSANVTLNAEVSNDSHTHAFANITSKPTTLSGYGITDAVLANTAITGATKTKITFDAKGLVTAGADLVAADIPNLDTAKITTGTFAIARIPTGTTSSTVSLGDHTHTFASLTSKPTTLSGYGITDAASTSDLTNRPEIYYNASANSDGDLVLDLDSDGAVA